MAARTSPTDLKRKSEAEQVQPSKRHLAEKPEEFDLYPLFLTIISALSEEEGARVSVRQTVAFLTQNPEVLFPFQQVPIFKINEAFKQFLINEKATQTQSAMLPVITSKLYHISLRNSSTADSIKQATQDIPALRATFNKGVKREITALLEQAKAMLSANPAPPIKKIQGLCLKLKEYQHLKRYTDTNENHRMKHLAEALAQEESETQYPAILSDYLPLAKEIQNVSRELDQVSKVLPNLTALLLKLQDKSRQPIKLDPWKVRYYDPYAQTFYAYFADHFWNLLGNGNKIDYTLLNDQWTTRFPNYDFDTWIIATLKSQQNPDRLEAQLEAKNIELRKIQSEKSLPEKDKATLKECLQGEMKTLCAHALPLPPTLDSLKKILQESHV